MIEKLAKMNIIKRRMNDYSIFAVLALGGILAISLGPKSANAGNELRPFGTYGEMYDVCTNSINIDAVKGTDIHKTDEEDFYSMDKHFSELRHEAIEIEKYAEKFQTTESDLIFHLQCANYILEREDLKNLDDFLKTQLYVKFWALYLVGRVFLLRENPLTEKELSTDERNRLYDPDVRLLLIYLAIYGFHAPFFNPIFKERIPSYVATKGKDKLNETNEKNDNPQKSLFSLQIQHIGLFRCVENAALRQAPDYTNPQIDISEERNADLRGRMYTYVLEDFEKYFKNLNSFFLEILPGSFTPPPPFPDVKKEYKYLTKIINSNVMDGEIRENESRVSSIIAALVKIIQESARDEASSSSA